MLNRRLFNVALMLTSLHGAVLADNAPTPKAVLVIVDGILVINMLVMNIYFIVRKMKKLVN